MCFFRWSHAKPPHKVFIDDIVNILLPMKLERYQLTRDEYTKLRRSGLSDNDLERRFLSGEKVYSFPEK